MRKGTKTLYSWISGHTWRHTPLTAHPSSFYFHAQSGLSPHHHLRSRSSSSSPILLDRCTLCYLEMPVRGPAAAVVLESLVGGHSLCNNEHRLTLFLDRSPCHPCICCRWGGDLRSQT